MKQIIVVIFTLMLASGVSSAQEEGFSVKVNKDTILAGNVLDVSFIANNVAGQFEAPDLGDLNVVSGPNTSTSMSMINGSVTQHASYSYRIFLEDIGEVIIPPAYLNTKEGTLETEPLSIIILPNPAGIIDENPSQSGFYQFSFPSKSPSKKKPKSEGKKKKKRKLKKI